MQLPKTVDIICIGISFVSNCWSGTCNSAWAGVSRRSRCHRRWRAGDGFRPSSATISRGCTRPNRIGLPPGTRSGTWWNHPRSCATHTSTAVSPPRRFCATLPWSRLAALTFGTGVPARDRQTPTGPVRADRNNKNTMLVHIVVMRCLQIYQ